ncbi:MFS transporter TsgA [Serratia liquefaciens]|uniref:MFS transporter TsgA n=1 Tax=Serratia liquefaciens TaxID=614 RepID=UPI0021830A63|nr:MFS transporter TsgA [Serratia liquefaciens]CAI2492158.1 putative transporter [Serratia liquefaciens]
MSSYQASLLSVSFMTYMVMAGLLTQIGIVIKPMSVYLGIGITDAAAMFSYLTGGTLLGTFISMAVYSRFEIRHILRITYAIFLIVLAALVFLDVRNPFVVSGYLFILGTCCGTGLSGGAVLISKVFNENKRASAFIATDCAFSASGFIFPSMATMIVAANMQWTTAYGLAGVIAALVFISTFVLRYPKEDLAESRDGDANANNRGFNFREIMTPRVVLMGFALCVYLFAQSTFLTWSPSYLQQAFGLSAAQSGAAVGNYWGPSVFGLITAAVLVNRIPARKMLVAVSLIAIVLTFYLSMTPSPKVFLTLTLGFGFLTSCVYKLGISVGSQQVKNSPAVLVTFLLTCGTVGSTVSPALSAAIVERFGVASAMLMTALGFTTVCMAIVACLLLEKIENTKSTKEIYS